jgi:hypothetical protein
MQFYGDTTYNEKLYMLLGVIQIQKRLRILLFFNLS